MLEACVEIVPSPKLVLEVEADATSDKFEAFTNFAVNWSCAFDDNEFMYWNSVLETDPSASFVTAIFDPNCESVTLPVKFKLNKPVESAN